FYFYLTESILQLIPPFSLVIVCVLVLYWIKFRKHVVTWITFPFVALHFFIAHKELRFLFPVLNFVPFIVLYFFQSFEEKKNVGLSIIKSKRFIYLFMIVNFIALAVFT